MRFIVFVIFLWALLATVYGAPQSKLQKLDAGGSVGGPQFVDEVTVESILNVRRPTGERSARQGAPQTRVSLRDGTKVTQS